MLFFRKTLSLFRHLQRSVFRQSRHFSASWIWRTEPRFSSVIMNGTNLGLIGRTLPRVSAGILASNQSRQPHFPGSVLRYWPFINHGTGSVLRYGQSVNSWRKNYTWNPKKTLKIEKAYLGFCIHRDSTIEFRPLIAHMRCSRRSSLYSYCRRGSWRSWR